MLQLALRASLCHSIGNTVASGRETSAMGKHRTEATEVTEGDLVGAQSNSIGNTVASGRRNKRNGEASHRGHRGHRGGIWVGSQSNSMVTPWLPGGEISATGKHRTEVTEGGFGLVPRVILSVTPWLPGGEISAMGKHRTEATEVTKGGFGLVPQSNSIGNTVASGRETSAMGKHRTEATEVTEGGFGLVPRVILSLTRWLPGGETSAIGKASHRGHRGHRGGIWVGAQSNSIGNTVASGRRNKRNGESIAQRAVNSRDRWDVFCPEGLQDSAQGFNPGNLKINEFALTRHMNVRSMNNTRSSGLEMLKGREADKINLAPIAARKLNGQSRRATIRFCFHVVSTLNLPPLQGVSIWEAAPRVETGLKPWAESSSPFPALSRAEALRGTGVKLPF